jgi:hypothetical protein
MSPPRPVQALARIALAALLAYFLFSRTGELHANVGARDSIAYWAAGRLLLQHENPYDAATVLALERQQGYTEAKALVLRTPPWSLFLMLPLGILNAFWAWIVWIGLSVGVLIWAVRVTWRIFGEGTRPPPFWVIIGYCFAPVPACLVAGQFGMLLLLGIVLFLFLEQNYAFWAGAALILPFAKPHLLSLVWLALALWVCRERKGRIAGGFVSAISIATAIALMFDPVIFQHYRAMLQDAAIGQEFIPALSGVLRLLLLRPFFWAAFIPMSVALVWCTWFYFVNRSKWNWRDQGLTLLVVSVLTTPYAWLTDEVVLLPAMLQAALWIYCVRQRITMRTRVALAFFASLNLLLLLILAAKVPFATGIYFWSGQLLISCFFCASRIFSTANPRALRLEPGHKEAIVGDPHRAQATTPAGPGNSGSVPDSARPYRVPRQSWNGQYRPGCTPIHD